MTEVPQVWTKYKAYPPKKAPAGVVWTGDCGCGLTPQEHVNMALEDRKKHVSIPPKGTPPRPA